MKEQTPLESELEGLVLSATRDSPRTLQANNFQIGASDIGGCRERLRYFVLETPETDEQDSYMYAFVGSAVGEMLEREAQNKGWQVQQTVRAQIQVEDFVVKIQGHLDMYRPGLVLDHKTKNGVGKLREPERQHIWQVTIYGLAMIQAGLEDPETLELAIAYWDRTGETQKPNVFTWKFNWDHVKEIQEWIYDVLYALAHDEEAPKDKPINWCSRFCSVYSKCRVPYTDVTGVITEEEVINATSVYLKAREEEKEARFRKEMAGRILRGLTGNVNVEGQVFQVRSTWINDTEVPGFYRAGYWRTDVHKSRSKKK